MPPDPLDELLEEAGRRSLTEEEIEALATMAIRTDAVTSTIGRLMSSGPTGAVNLRNARRLRAVYTSRLPSLDLTPARTPDRPSRSHRGAHTRIVVVTEHAVDRFIERCRPDLSFNDAKAEIHTLVADASALRAKTINGQEQWQARTGNVFVIRRDGPGRPPVCVTVLVGPDNSPAPAEQDTPGR